jgi:hypothetical protein
MYVNNECIFHGDFRKLSGVLTSTTEIVIFSVPNFIVVCDNSVMGLIKYLS